MSCSIGHRCGLDPALLWLWYRQKNCSSNLPPSLGTPKCHRCGPRKKKKKKGYSKSLAIREIQIKTIGRRVGPEPLCGGVCALMRQPCSWREAEVAKLRPKAPDHWEDKDVGFVSPGHCPGCEQEEAATHLGCPHPNTFSSKQDKNNLKISLNT